MSRPSLLLIDIQNDYFPGGNWEVHGMEAAASHAAEALKAARAAGAPVIHIRHEATNPAVPFFQPGTDSAEIHPSVAPAPGEPVILKHRPNAFLGTDLADLLADIAPDQLLIAGAMSQMCIDATTRAAADLGHSVTVLHDACAAKAQSFSGQDVPAPMVHAAIMAALEGTYAEVLTSREVITRYL